MGKYLDKDGLVYLWNNKIKPIIPTKTSDLTNDSGFLTSYTETDPTVPSWAKASTKPSYTASEVGAAPTSHTHDDRYYTESEMDTKLGGKVDTVTGKGLSTNDYTTTEKNKLAGIATGAEANVQSDWNVTDTTSDAFIKNKPSIPSKTSDLTNDSGYITSAPVTSVNSKTGAVSLTASDVGASASGHTHDDRYYTETEINTKLEGKSDTGHTHTEVNGHTVEADVPSDAIFTDTVYTHPTYTAAAAAAIKVGRDASGHVAIGSALTASDVGAAASSHSHSTATTSAAGFLPKLGGGTTNFLRADGTWASPDVTGVYQKKEGTHITTGSSTSTIPINIDGYRTTDMLFVDIDGLALVEGTEYTISGTNIVLTTPITSVGAIVHFTAIRLGATSSENLSQLKGDKGDSGLTKTEILNTFYPVGSYYETSDTSFNPANAWGGTWELETEGLVHIGAGSTYTAGSTGGEATHTLTADESGLKAHSVSYTDHTYTAKTASRKPGTSTAVTYATGITATSNTRTANVSAADADTAHNNMQPYIAVNRWHRTA